MVFPLLSSLLILVSESCDSYLFELLLSPLLTRDGKIGREIVDEKERMRKELIVSQNQVIVVDGDLIIIKILPLVHILVAFTLFERRGKKERKKKRKKEEEEREKMRKRKIQRDSKVHNQLKRTEKI